MSRKKSIITTLSGLALAAAVIFVHQIDNLVRGGIKVIKEPVVRTFPVREELRCQVSDEGDCVIEAKDSGNYNLTSRTPAQDRIITEKKWHDGASSEYKMPERGMFGRSRQQWNEYNQNGRGLFVAPSPTCSYLACLPSTPVDIVEAGVLPVTLSPVPFTHLKDELSSEKKPMLIPDRETRRYHMSISGRVLLPASSQ